jgi:3-dehydroquinate dehydratase-1
MEIPAIFEREGEAGFRRRETEALRALAPGAPFVAATGGGAVLAEENRRLMAGSGWVVALEGTPETLRARIEAQLRRAEGDAVRPLLDAADPLRQLRELKERRQPLYALADWTVHTDRLAPAQVADEVVRAVRLLEGAPPAGPRAAKRLDLGGDTGAAAPPLICAPLVGATREALVAEARAAAARRPDLVEWRVDFFAGIGDAGEVVDVARAIREAAGAPLLFTRRAAREGGRPVPISEARVGELYAAVCAAACVDAVDCELASPEVARVREAARSGGRALVLSFHDLERTPPAGALARAFDEAERLGADLAKVAVTPAAPEDVLALLAATLEADRRLRIPVAGISMGELGAVTRVAGWAFGSALTFAVAGGGASAPGQLPIDELRAAIALLRRAGAPAR